MQDTMQILADKRLRCIKMNADLQIGGGNGA